MRLRYRCVYMYLYSGHHHIILFTRSYKHRYSQCECSAPVHVIMPCASTLVVPISYSRSLVQGRRLSFQVSTKVLRWELSLPGQLFIDMLGLFRAVRIQCMPPMPPPIISGPPRATQSVSHAVQETGRANTRRLSSS